MAADAPIFDDPVRDLAHQIGNWVVIGRAHLLTAVSDLESVPHDAQVVLTLLDEVTEVPRQFASEGAIGRAPTRDLAQKRLHRLAGCLGVARAQVAVARGNHLPAPVNAALDEIDAGLASVSSLLADYKAEKEEALRRRTLREGILRAVERARLVHGTVDLSDHAAFDLLADSRFMRTFLEEAIMNARKHGLAPIGVSGECVDGWIKVSVSDGGPGFDTGQVEHGFGITVLEKCASALGGVLEIEADPCTRVGMRFPYEARK
jgi:signal transduction histidine kinase